MNKSILAFVFITVQISTLLSAQEVQLPNGLIRGRQETTIQNKNYYAFEKIPYAAPPVGDLRFKAPVPPANWNDPLNTLDLDVECYQVGNGDLETEDCLYLNVFTPELPTAGNNVSLPVMLYIHGGGFVGGSGRRTYSDRLINEDIILVVINYRLGPFGFLSSGDEVIPGNNGLKDQHLAIKWTHDNIQLFGGDPEKITIFGQSAGSASCAYQLLNQDNKGLIKGAILESGSFLSPWAFQRSARDIAFATAAILNDTFQTNRNSNDLLEYLLKVSAQELDTASERYRELASSTYENNEIVQGFYWAPVVEVQNPDAFLTRKMYGLLSAGNVVAVPTLIGFNSEESIAFNQDPNALRNYLAALDANLNWLVPHDMEVTDIASGTEIGRQIRDIYTNGDLLVNHLGDGVRYFSDTSFTRSIIKQAELYSSLAETYFYEFSYNGQIGHQNQQYEGAEQVGHSQELGYIFCAGAGCDVSGYPQGDQVTEAQFIQIWSNFAKFQNPTPEPSEVLQNITWPLVSTSGGDFLYVDIDQNLEIRNHPKEASYGKWVYLYNGLNYDDFDTY